MCKMPRINMAILLMVLPCIGYSLPNSRYVHNDHFMRPKTMEKTPQLPEESPQADSQVPNLLVEKALTALALALPVDTKDLKTIVDYSDQVCQEFGCSRANQYDLLALLSLQMMERNMTDYIHNAVDASWEYNTDVNLANAQAMNEASVELSEAYNAWWTNLLEPYDYENLTVPWIKRQFELQQSIGTAILEGDYLVEFNELLSAMSAAYTNKICEYEEHDCDVDDEGIDIDELEIRMATTRDYSELNYYWTEWRDSSGNEVIEEFHDYVFLLNKAAELNGFTDAGEMWLQPYVGGNYTVEDFKKEIEILWLQLAEFYELLHGYVRDKLMNDDEYEDEFEDDRDPIPASITGNMWAQDWGNIYDIVQPFRDELIDISDTLSEYSNVNEMFKMSEDFFTSMGLLPMTEDFWNNSLFEQPDDREVICHASAWDFYSKQPYLPKDGKYRVKMCTHTSQEDFITVHHEMGHSEYQMAYTVLKDLDSEQKPQLVNPVIYRDGANPGFHEAIGDTIALSVSTQSHLAKIEANLTGTPMSAHTNLTHEQTINFLMKQALSKIAFLPYAYILDQWRWEVFAGDIRTADYNWAWWKKRLTYQGLRPPVPRASELDFDTGCKYHVLANVPYIRYFVAHILQFQFHERLCELAGQGDVDIFNCDIYGSEEAGEALYNLLKNGRSIPWQKQLADFLGTEGKMNASAILHYFEPLITFLKEEVEQRDITLGWTTSDSYLEDYIVESEEISPIVPVVVGVVLIVMVLLVLIAFFVGNSRRQKLTEDDFSEKSGMEGQTNKTFDMTEKKSKAEPSTLEKVEKISEFYEKEKAQDATETFDKPEIVITHPVAKDEKVEKQVTDLQEAEPLDVKTDKDENKKEEISPFDELSSDDDKDREENVKSTSQLEDQSLKDLQKGTLESEIKDEVRKEEIGLIDEEGKETGAKNEGKKEETGGNDEERK